MNIYKFGYTAVFIFFLFTPVALAIDSTDVILPNVRPSFQDVIVIGQGQTTAFCKSDGSVSQNCTLRVSNTRCPPDFKPQLNMSVHGNEYPGCQFQRYYINGPHDGGVFTPYVNSYGGYSWVFWNAFAKFSCQDKNVTVSWMAVCVRTGVPKTPGT